MPSWHPLSPRWLRFAILAPLASEAGSRGTVSPSLSSCLVDGARSAPRWVHGDDGAAGSEARAEAG